MIPLFLFLKLITATTPRQTNYPHRNQTNINRIEYIENFSDIKLSRKLGAFSRYKGERENGVSAWTWPRSLPSVSEEFLREDILKFKESLPPGYRLEQAGEAAESAESNAQLFASAIVFFILILVGLVFALNSLTTLKIRYISDSK